MENWTTIDWVVFSMMATFALGTVLGPLIFFMAVNRGELNPWESDDE